MGTSECYTMSDPKDMVEKIEAFLDKIAFMQELQEKTGLRKIFLAGGIAFVVLMFILFGFGAGLLCNFVGFVYPAYASFKALEADNHVEDRQWLTYWVVYSCFCLVEGFLEMVLFWVPFYYPLKLAFLFYLFLPKTKGAMQIYEKYLQAAIRPYVGLIDDAAGSAINQAASIGRKVSEEASAAIGKEVLKEAVSTATKD